MRGSIQCPTCQPPRPTARRARALSWWRRRGNSRNTGYVWAEITTCAHCNSTPRFYRLYSCGSYRGHVDDDGLIFSGGPPSDASSQLSRSWCCSLPAITALESLFCITNEKPRSYVLFKGSWSPWRRMVSGGINWGLRWANADCWYFVWN